MTAFKGKLEKCHWAQIRDEVVAVNPELAAVIDTLSPGPKYRLYKGTYPYGSQPMEKALLMLPNDKGDLVPVTDPSLSQQVRDDLSYNLLSNPVSLVLKNSFEIFLPLEDRTVPMGGLIEEGGVFGAWRVVNPKKADHPAFIWDMTSGARSIFMLPKITEVKKHMKLKKIYDLTMDVPKTLMKHWEIFRQIANHTSFGEAWNARILYFSKEWFRHLHDENWKVFYQLFYETSWSNSELWRNQPIWNLVLSLILKEYEARPSAYIVDIVKYLLYMGIGAFPGLVPAVDNLAGPFKQIQRVYAEEYEIRNYPPVIMQPGIFDMSKINEKPVYYSLQFPSALEFKPSTRMRTSIINDLHEIRSLIIRCKQDLLADKFNLKGSSFYDLFRYAQYDYFHTGVDLHFGMRHCSEMFKEDVNLVGPIEGKVYDVFPETCSFAKGCIRLSRKKN